MSDWQRFLREVSWFVDSADAVTVGETRPWAREPIAGLPELSALLDAASRTPISINDTPYELLAWGSPENRRGWLCRPPQDDNSSVAPIHQRMWKVCGGMVERFGEPDTWWNNQNQVLTADAAQLPLAEVLTDYAELWSTDDLAVPIDPDEYYAAAIEANGNLTLARSDNGGLLLFAPDHDFDGVTPLAGCPPYTLLTIDDVPDLTAWIEVCAAAWRD